MYKVLIVDDEAVERRGLKVLVDWKKYDFEVCGEAIDGKDGLNKVEELKPDVVFADIRMPYMDGLEMIEELNKRACKCKVVVLTGYAEFEYAQKAISYGVKVYLLKPFDENEISVILGELKKTLMEEEEHRRALYKSVTTIRGEIISSLITGTLNVNSIGFDREIDNLFMGWKNYQVMLIDMEYREIPPARLNEYKAKINQYTTENGYGYAFIVNSQLGILLNRSGDKVPNSQVENFRNIITTIVGGEVKFILGSLVDNVLEIYLSYKAAENIVKKKFFFGDYSIINADIISQAAARLDIDGELDIFEMINSIYIFITLNDLDKIVNKFNRLKSQMVFKEYSEERIKGTYANVYRSIIQKLVENGELGKEVFEQDDKVICELYGEKNLESLSSNIVRRLSHISNNLFEDNPNYKIKKLVDYVNANYDKDLKLEELCVMYNYSQSYIGKLFKNYTGQKFDAYIDQLRIEKAKELLRKGMKTGDVAKKSGFNNIDYFYIKFKRYVGLTPKEFKSVIYDDIAEE